MQALFNILPCISLKTNKDLGRVCIPVTYHVNMHHARYRGELKRFPHKPNEIQLLDCVGGGLKRVVTASNSSNWGSPPVAPQCTTLLNFLFPVIIMKLGLL